MREGLCGNCVMCVDTGKQPSALPACVGTCTELRSRRNAHQWNGKEASGRLEPPNHANIENEPAKVSEPGIRLSGSPPPGDSSLVQPEGCADNRR